MTPIGDTSERDPAAPLDEDRAPAPPGTRERRPALLVLDHYRVMFEQSPEAIFISGMDGRPLHANPAALALVGYDLDTLLRLRPEDILTPHPVWTPDALERFLGEGYWQGELQMRLRNGTIVPVEARAVVLAGTNDALFATFVRDISAHKEAAAELATAHQSLRDLLESTSDGVAMFDQAWRYIYFNQRAEEMMGRGREEILGKPALEVFPEVASSPVIPALQRAMSERLPVSVEMFYPPAEIWFEVRAFPSPTGLAVFFRDVTERKRRDDERQAALAAAQLGHQLKTRFLRMMSHELRTPVQSILGYADLLLAGGSGELTAEQAADIRYIRHGAARMIALVNQVLDLSHLEVGEVALASEQINLPHIIERVRQEIAPDATTKGLELATEIPASLPLARGDPMRVRQILLNLVSNAIKFTPRGSVRIIACQAAHGVDVAVRDTGIGIAAEDLARIFDEFQQVDSGMTRRFEGAGLGLAIAGKLAEQMGGSIDVQSAPGAGSTFTLHLPAI